MGRTHVRYAGALLLLAAGSPVVAQTAIEAGPVFGYYRPTGTFKPAPVYSIALPRSPQDLSGVAWGGQARIWLGPRIGAEIQVTTAASTKGVVNTPAGPMGPISARVTTGTAQLLYDFLPTSAGSRAWLSAGPGVVRHGGEAYAGVGSQTDLAGAAGLGGSISISRAVRAAAGVTALFYSYDVAMPADLRAAGESLQKGFQSDVLVSVGVTWALH